MTFRRYLKNPWIYISAAILIIALFFGAREGIEWYRQNLNWLSGECPPDVNITAVQEIVDHFNGYEVFMDGIGEGTSIFYKSLAMLVVGFLFTGSYAQRLADGSGLTEITRTGYRRYYAREVLKNFLSTFIFITVVLMIFLLMCILAFSAKTPFRGEHLVLFSPVRALYYEVPFLYCTIQILNQALFLSLFSLLCMGTAAFCKKDFVNRISPLILYIFLLVVSDLLFQFLNISWFSLLYPDIIFVTYRTSGGTALGFIGEKVCAYLLLALAIVCVHSVMYRKYRKNYLN